MHMYTRKKLDEMTVVCESFLEHLRVQSQVLVGPLELTWPPAGWALCRPSRPPPHNLHFLTSPLDGELNRACGRDSKEISFLPETRHSSLLPPPRLCPLRPSARRICRPSLMPAPNVRPVSAAATGQVSFDLEAIKALRNTYPRRIHGSGERDLRVAL